MNGQMDDATLEWLFAEQEGKRRLGLERERIQEERLRDAARGLLQNEEGKLFLSWLIGRTGVFASSFTGNNTTFYLEGRRSVGLDLYRLLMTSDPLALQRLVSFLQEGETHD